MTCLRSTARSRSLKVGASACWVHIYCGCTKFWVPRCIDVSRGYLQTNRRTRGGELSGILTDYLVVVTSKQDATVQALLAEALNDLFEKYGKKPIA
jgi:hypothetical protein